MILNPISNEDTNLQTDKWTCKIRISTRVKRIQKHIANGSDKRISYMKYCILNFANQLDTKD